MKILAFDTATITTTCALVEEGKVLGSASLSSKRTHSETLIGMIEAMLDHLGMDLSEVDLIGVGIGPGSFTGLRISVVLAKVLGKSLNVPVVGVSTLAALARGVAGDGVVIPALDARRNRVYTARFEKEGSALYRLTDDDAHAVDAVMEAAPQGAIIIGDGTLRYGEAFRASDKDFFLYPEALSKVQAAMIAEEAEEVYRKEGASDIYKLEPNYLRPSQAMREYRRKHGQSQDA